VLAVSGVLHVASSSLVAMIHRSARTAASGPRREPDVEAVNEVID
jgi:hypothetical protein